MHLSSFALFLLTAAAAVSIVSAAIATSVALAADGDDMVPLDLLDMSSIVANRNDLRLLYETEQAVAAIGGLRNRHAPSLYVINNADIDNYWLGFLQRRDGGAPKLPSTFRNITSLHQLVSDAVASGVVRGLCIYDDTVYSTSLVCSTAAGVQNLLPVCGRPGSPILALANSLNIPVAYDLRNKFSGPSNKTDAYVWALQEFGSQLGAGFLAYYPAYDWTRQSSGPFPPSLAMNHDFVIKNKGFFFDLDPWPSDIPADAPNEPVGADYRTMLQIFAAAYKLLGGSSNNKLIHLTGFPPWWMNKYSPSGVALEWQFSNIASSYNIFMDADACCLPSMTNAALYSLWSPYTTRRRFAQNPAPTVASLMRQGLVDPSTGRPFKHMNYAMFYAGDYDSASWQYSQLHTNFGSGNTTNGAARHRVKIGWAVDSMALARFPIIFDWLFDEAKLSPLDRVIAGDSGYGYVNPTQLLPPRSPSGAPSGAAAWIEACSRGYGTLSVNFTGFIINGASGPLNEQTLQMYCNFSSAGVVIQSGYYSGDSIQCNDNNNGVVTTPVFSEKDLPSGDSIAGGQFVLQNFQPGAFSVYRSVLKSASYHADVAGAVAAQNANIKFVDPLELSLLFKLSKSDTINNEDK